MKILLSLMGLILLSGCDSPWQGSGALYIAKKGVIECVQVDAVTFISTRITEYTINGIDYTTHAALDYYANEQCKY